MSDPPPGPAPSPPSHRNRAILIATTGVIALSLTGLLLLFPNGHDTLKRSTFNTDGRPSVGTGPVQIVVFSDYQCPACKEFNEQHLPALTQRYARTGRATITELASPIFGQSSEDAATAAECVHRQNPQAYWTYTDRLFNAQRAENTWITPQLLLDLAPPGINRSALQRCLNDPAARTAVQADRQQHEKAGLRGTPTVFVNGQRARDYGSKTIAALVDKLTPPSTQF